MLKKLRGGKIKVEINVLSPEKVINTMCNRGLTIYKVKKKSISVITLRIDNLDYNAVREIVKREGGKIEIIGSEGFVLGRIKKSISLFIGAGMFVVLLFILSNYVWAIEINVGDKITPFEIRQQLKEIGIGQGVKKSSLNVKEIESKLESMNSEILWLRARVEGSTLKINIEEKINPPGKWQGSYGNLVATIDGTIKRVYTYSGKSAVVPGDVVKAGQVLIKGIEGMEGQEYLVQPRGVVIANTFYEKEIVAKIEGTTLERSGEKDRDVYIKLFGKKIYLKKFKEGFLHYDKVEKSGNLLHEVLYYERVEKKIEASEDSLKETALKELEAELIDELPRDAKIADKIITKGLDGKGNLKIKIVFVVEQNILEDVAVTY